MRTLFFGECRIGGEQGALHCRYEILVRSMEGPVACESYGIRLTLPHTGEQAEIPDLTIRPERIEALAGLLLRGGVTPCALRDVVEDWL